MQAEDNGSQGEAGPHQVYHWRGSPFEIGFQHGQRLRNEILREAHGRIEEFARRRNCSESKALQFVRAEWEPLFAQHTPRSLEEIKGIAAGTGFDYSWI